MIRPNQKDDPEVVAKQKMKDPKFNTLVNNLADLLDDKRCNMVYTGAGLSTNASIPDYRGEKGVRTLQDRREPHPGCPDLRAVNPTVAHCILKLLLQKQKVHHIISQNCDGLHLRSGVPQSRLSEIHGNSFIEFCPTCRIHYKRTFEVTATSDKRSHQTPRKCDICQGCLVDTIVYTGETRYITYPQNWAAVEALRHNIEVIIVLGTSCEILAGYDFLFPDNAMIYVINKGPTRLDKWKNVVKIREDCDVFMYALYLCFKFIDGYPSYCRECDPLLNAASHVGIDDWPQCSCGRRPSRKFVSKTKSVPLLPTESLPSWMLYSPSADVKRKAVITTERPPKKIKITQ